MSLPQEILDRCRRVYDYHHSTKHTYESVRAHPIRLDPATQPSVYRVFEQCPKTPLPTSLLDVSVPTIALLDAGFDAIPESQLNPPQNLKTLATWLHLSYGQTIKHQVGQGSRATTTWIRSCPSQGQLYPVELYVAAFAIDGLEPGFYHYSVREFALRKLRTGHEALAALTRGRPDLNFLKTVPLTILVSTIFWRSAWRYERRGYRQALLDAGHVVGNLTTVALGLGITTIARLRTSNATSRELIGLPPDAPFGEEEAVHAMVTWADRAANPMPAGNGPPQPMAPIARAPLSKEFKTYGSIVATHFDCVAPGVAVKEVRPPHTELTPLPPTYPTVEFPPISEFPGGGNLRKVLLTRYPMTNYDRRSIPRDDFRLLNHLAFRGGSVFPMFPDGPHVGLVRPLWVTHDVTGMDDGVWYYNPVTDAWSLLHEGDMRKQAAFLSLEQEWTADGFATCFIVANVNHLMTHAGPDTYRLAHLEAGIVAQRLYLAANALGHGCGFSGLFYDDEVRNFFGLAQSGWEVMYEVALGVPLQPGQRRVVEEASADDEGIWRD
jgi:SagB-type dehydrogenase family enzyme